jgi:hypothetical protein
VSTKDGMASWLIDDRGVCWDNQSPRLAERLQASLTGEPLALYCVKNLGFVAINDRVNSTHIKLRPAVVKPIALAACLYWVGDRQRRLGRIALSLHEHDWQHCIFDSFQSAVRALAQCVKSGQEDRSRSNSRQALRPQDLPSDSHVADLLRYWSGVGGRHDEQQLQTVLHSVLRDRYFLLEAHDPTGHLVVHDIGRNYRFLDTAWRARARGSRFEDLPDFCYGTWVADAYRQALDTGQPQIDRIEAVLDLAGAGLSRVRYTRVIVPFVTHDDRRMVLSTSAVHDIVENVDRPGQHLGQIG